MTVIDEALDDDILLPSQLGSSSEVKVRPAREGDEIDAIRFEMEFAWESNRDQWGRPLVRKPNGQYWGYRRASSFGSPNENTRLLDNWKMRQLSRAIARYPALQMAVTRLERELDSATEAGDFKRAKKARKDWDDLCETALKRVGSEDAADIGTGVHDILELDDLGKDIGYVPEAFVADLSAYRRLRRCFKTLSSELIVVNDRFEIGGKFDRVVELLYDLEAEAADGSRHLLPAGVAIIGDVKTSQNMDFAASKFGCQCWAYANSKPYDPRPGKHKRYKWPHQPPRTDFAVIMHVPSGKGLASLYWVDLKHYDGAIKAAGVTYDWRNSKGKRGIVPGQVFEDYALTVARATSVADLHASHARAIAADEWTPELKEIFTARRVELERSA